MKYLPKKVQTILEKHGFVHRNDWEVDKQDYGCFVELNQDTPAGGLQFGLMAQQRALYKPLQITI